MYIDKEIYNKLFSTIYVNEFDMLEVVMGKISMLYVDKKNTGQN